jgi:subtilisin-like proprotein convertase family protein
MNKFKLLFIGASIFIFNFNTMAEYGLNNQNKFLAGLGVAGSYVTIPHQPAFDQASDGTIEAWVYIYQNQSNCIIHKGTSPQSFYLYTTAAGGLYAYFGGYTINSGATIPLFEWTHIAFTWSSTPTETISFYVNGSIAGAPINTNFTWTSNTEPIEIGATNNANYFKGYIDEVRYWGTARTISQIQSNRFTGIGDGSGANSSSALVSGDNYFGLISSWNFNTSGIVYDYISGYNGTFMGSASVTGAIPGQPVPYNFVLDCPNGANDYVTVPGNAIFNQSDNGTFDAWVYQTSQTTSQAIFSRGSAARELLWGVKQTTGNRQVLDIGNTSFDNTGGTAIPIFKWTHLAVKWQQSGSNYTVTFYVNGEQSGTPVTQAATWTSATGSLLIGGAFNASGNNWDGFLDETRFWSTALTHDQIKAYMFNSCRTGNMSNLVGAWNFDGNLLNFGTATGINGSLNTGGTNNCRMSAYLNEATPGAITGLYITFPTVINRTSTGNPFPGGFAVKSPNKPISDLQTTKDTIVITGSGNISSVEVFISVQHGLAEDLDITLRAPNGVARNLSSDNGGFSQNGYLTFFVDGETSVTGSTFYPPYTHAAGPEAGMGNMGNSPVSGNWIIEVTDDDAGATGTLKGWGIRLNGTLTGLEPVSNTIPGKFELMQNYPNPFNPVTNIQYHIPNAGLVTLVVYDILGREVQTLVNEELKAGIYNAGFDGGNFSSGAYFYKITANGFTDIKKMMLVK